MQPTRSIGAEELRRRIRALDGREFQLQTSALVALLVVVAGLVGVMLPNTLAKLGIPWIDDRSLPQIFLGFIGLSVLFGVWLFNQRKGLYNARNQLARQVLGTEGPENLSLIDSLTGILNRRYLDRCISKELALADRLGMNLTFLMIDVQGFKSLNARFGRPAGDRALIEVGKLLKKTFRGADTLIRYGADDFLVLMPACNEQQAQDAAERLLAQVDHWNRESGRQGYRLALSYSTAAYAKGTHIATLLGTACRRMHQHKERQPITG